MQTFLPWPDFTATAACLDGKRLGKQIVEGCQIMRCLTGNGSLGWNSHPIVAAWRGSEGTLMSYLNAVHGSWQCRRGDVTHHEAYTHCRDIYDGRGITRADPPWWLGSPGFHVSHQLNLIRKNGTYRSAFSVSAECAVDREPYLWPVEPGFFQVATRGNGIKYADWFPSGRITGKRLVVTANEADERAQSLFSQSARLIGQWNEKKEEVT